MYHSAILLLSQGGRKVAMVPSVSEQAICISTRARLTASTSVEAGSSRTHSVPDISQTRSRESLSIGLALCRWRNER